MKTISIILSLFLIVTFSRANAQVASEQEEVHNNEKAQFDFNPAIPQVKKLANQIYQYNQFFYNGLIIITKKGVIVTDPGGKVRAKAMREEITKLTDKPVIKVIYTHDHYDHTRGGQIFKDEGAEFISHENAVDLISRDPKKETIIPTKTFKNKMRIRLDNEAVLNLLYYGPNDGDAITVFHLPKEKILFAVDFHTPGMLVESFRLVTLNYSQVYRTLKQIKQDLEFDIVVSGHSPFSSPELYDLELRFIESLYTKTLAGIQSGKSTEQLMSELKFPEVEHWMGYKENLPAHIQRMAYSIWHGN